MSAALHLLTTALVTVGLLGSSVALALQVRVVPVLTGSMAPAVPAGALAITTRLDGPDVQVGKVIVFRPPAGWTNSGDLHVLHRAHQIRHVDGTRMLTTKGDANPAPDPWTIDLDADGDIAQVRAVLPSVGRVLAGGPSGAAALLAGAALLTFSASTRLRHPCTPRRTRVTHGE